MAKMVQIEPVPGFKPADANQAAAYSDAVKAGVLTLPYSTAIENIRLSNGIYRFVPAATVESPGVNLVPLSERSAADLKMMMVTLGLEPKQSMRKAEMAIAITERLAGIETEADD